eukprot:2675056-Prymnesium_polylepis.1
MLVPHLAPHAESPVLGVLDRPASAPRARRSRETLERAGTQMRRKGSRATEAERKGSRATEAERKGSRATEAERKGSRATEAERKGSRATEAEGKGSVQRRRRKGR